MVLNYFRKAEPLPREAKASAGARVAVWGSVGRVAWSPRDTASLTKTGFHGNPVGYRAVKMIAEAAAALPVICQDTQRRYETHPALSLIARPNAAQGRADLMEAAYVQLLLSGNAYLEAVLADRGWPVELHVLRSDRMSVVPGTDGWPSAYDYAVGSRKHRFAAAEICHIKSVNPQDDHYGLAPLQAAATAIDVHNSAARWSKALLDNAARPSGAIVYRGMEAGGAMSQDQFERLQSELETHHQARGMRGARCCWRVGSIGNRWGSAPRTWSFRRPRRRRRGTSRWPSGCRRCSWAFRGMRPTPTMPRRIAPSSG
jgi:phage portal protein BeeE